VRQRQAGVQSSSSNSNNCNRWRWDLAGEVGVRKRVRGDAKIRQEALVEVVVMVVEKGGS
jgi:hypothetical protein